MDLQNLLEQINSISNIDDFLNFVLALAQDSKENPKEWANTTIWDYLGQMASYLDDLSVFDDDTDWERVDYKAFAKLLYMGKIYE